MVEDLFLARIQTGCFDWTVHGIDDWLGMGECSSM
jgi:hypothetical protein